VLYQKHRGCIQHQPTYIQEQRPNNCELARVQLVLLVEIFVVNLDQLDHLILLQRAEFFELLSEQIQSELQRSGFVEIIKVLQLLVVSKVSFCILG